MFIIVYILCRWVYTFEKKYHYHCHVCLQPDERGERRRWAGGGRRRGRGRLAPADHAAAGRRPRGRGALPAAALPAAAVLAAPPPTTAQVCKDELMCCLNIQT